MRTLHPAIAIIAMVALPMAIADDRSPPKVTDTGPAALFPPRETRVVRLKHGNAPNLCAELKAMFSADPVGPGGPLVATFDVDTNSVVLTGVNESVRKAQEIINQLDVAHGAGRATQLIRLQHADAGVMADLMHQVVKEQTTGRVFAYAPSVTMDRRTNTLIVISDPADFEAIRKTVESLDIPTGEPAAVQAGGTRARITVYQVSVPAAGATNLQASDLSDLKDDAGLTEHLGKIGPTKLLYVMEQGVDLEKHPSMNINSQLPIRTSVGKDGQTGTSVSYQNVGCSVNMEGRWPSVAADCGEVKTEVDLSCISPSKSASGDNAPIFTKVRQHFAGPFKSGQPIILLSLEAGGPSESTAYVTRIELRRGDGQTRKT